jgi:MATE family multidrug resistance protein
MPSSPRPTRASLSRLLTLAWPLIVSQSIWTVQIVLDRIFLSQHDTDSVGAGMSAVILFWMLLALFQFTVNYATTFVAQYTGAGQPRDVGPVIGQALWVAVASGLGFLLLIPLAGPIVALAGHEPALQAQEEVYFRWMCAAALPFLITAAGTSFFAGRGDTRSVLWINLAGLAVNGFWAYSLIYGHFGLPRLGIAGAGVATVLGGWASALLTLILLLHPAFVRDFRNGSGWGLDWPLLGRLLYFGLPQGISTAAETAAFSLFLIFIGRMGSADLSATSIACTLNLLAFLPMMGVGQAVEVLVGQSLGEDDPEAAERFVWMGVAVSVTFTLVVGLAYVVIPGWLALPFASPDDPAKWAQVSERIPLLLRFVAAYCLFDSVQIVFGFALRGAGDTRFVTWVTLILAFPIMVLPAWASWRFDWGMYVAWAMTSLYVVLLSAVLYARFAAGRWKRMRVIVPGVECDVQRESSEAILVP